VKMGSDADPGMFDKNKSDFVSTFPHRLIHQGQSAELVAEKYGISRKECDDFAARSHEYATKAIKAGSFKSRILPLDVEFKTEAGSKKVPNFALDECVRSSVDANKMAQLTPVFKKNGGVVTAGNASQVSDGAAAVLLASGQKADELGLRKRARVVARAVVGSDPELMLDGIIPATKLVLKKAGMKLEDIDVFEVNEAFASVVLAWAKELRVDMAKMNPNGGAIAHGHPLGATGCILMTKLVNELERSKKRYGLQTMCIGHGQATATIIERVDPAYNSSKPRNPTSKL